MTKGQRYLGTGFVLITAFVYLVLYLETANQPHMSNASLNDEWVFHPKVFLFSALISPIPILFWLNQSIPVRCQFRLFAISVSNLVLSLICFFALVELEHYQLTQTLSSLTGEWLGHF